MTNAEIIRLAVAIIGEERLQVMTLTVELTDVVQRVSSKVTSSNGQATPKAVFGNQIEKYISVPISEWQSVKMPHRYLGVSLHVLNPFCTYQGVFAHSGNITCSIALPKLQKMQSKGDPL
jgi:hypothetical protein